MNHGSKKNKPSLSRKRADLHFAPSTTLDRILVRMTLDMKAALTVFLENCAFAEKLKEMR